MFFYSSMTEHIFNLILIISPFLISSWNPSPINLTCVDVDELTIKSFCCKASFIVLNKSVEAQCLSRLVIFHLEIRILLYIYQLLILSTLHKVRDIWQLKMVIFLHRCLIHTRMLSYSISIKAKCICYAIN